MRYSEEARRQIQLMNRIASTPYTLIQKNLTWVLPTNKQILQRQMFEPLFNNKTPITKKR
jgi:hypothetical protein